MKKGEKKNLINKLILFIPNVISFGIVCFVIVVIAAFGLNSNIAILSFLIPIIAYLLPFVFLFFYENKRYLKINIYFSFLVDLIVLYLIVDIYVKSFISCGISCIGFGGQEINFIILLITAFTHYVIYNSVR